MSGSTTGKISGANLFTCMNYWIVACGGSPETNPHTLVCREPFLCHHRVPLQRLYLQVWPSYRWYKRYLPGHRGFRKSVQRCEPCPQQVRTDQDGRSFRCHRNRPLLADYIAKKGTPSTTAPKIFFRYYYVNYSTCEKSDIMLAETTWTAGEQIKSM